MNRVIVDFESYYNLKEDVSASVQGVQNYAKTADAYMVSVVCTPLGIKFVGTIEQAQAEFSDAFFDDPQNEFWAANANFDQQFKEKYWMEASKRPWKCILDHGATEQLPGSLSGIFKTLFGEKVDKSLRDWMNGKHYADLPTDRKQELLGYCLSDSAKEEQVLNRLPEPSAFEQSVAAHTRMSNRRGVLIDRDRLQIDREELLKHQHTSFLGIPWRNDDKPLSAPALGRWAAARGIPVPASLAKDDEECGDLLDAHPQLAEVVGAMRRFRKAGALIAKLESVEARLTDDNVMPLELMYCGARHTRRWSSRGVNVQNLDKEPYWLTSDGKPAQDAHNVWLRRLLVPRAGKVFLILDFAQVEPRCLNWLVGNDELLALIRQGFGIYEAYARVAGLWKDPGPLKKLRPDLYKNVKAQVLGLGYGMGANKYMETAAKDGIVLNLAEAQQTVKTWRELNPKVTGMWKDFDALVRKANQGNARKLEIQMPTGDWLRHFSVIAESKLVGVDEFGATTKKGGYKSYTIKGDFGWSSVQANLWGGVLTENVTQRMARDVLAESVLALEAAGLPVVFHAHDEVIVEVDDDPASRTAAMAEATAIMSREPAWAEGLPLAVEGDFHPHYVK